jgi:predicted amidohydrolase YtcJ
MPEVAVAFRRLLFPVLVLLAPLGVLAAPELILLNGDVHTVDPAARRAEAFAVEAGRFIAVGDNDSIRALADAGTRVIDAGGATVTPGFIDAHSHMSGNSPPVAGVDLSYVEDKADWLQLIAEADARMPAGEWMTGGYWDHTLSDGVYPTREMLDDVAPERPIFLRHIDGHYGWANSRALEIAGVSASTPVPSGGEIVLDPETGVPTGILLEGAMELVDRVVPERTDVRRREGLAQMQRYANSLGITGLHQMGGLQDYLHIVEEGDPTLRIWYGHLGMPDAPQEIDAAIERVLEITEKTAMRVQATGKEVSLGPLLYPGFVKLMNDGVLSAHTAVLMEAYSDRPGWRGEYLIQPGDLATAVARVTAADITPWGDEIGSIAVGKWADFVLLSGTVPSPVDSRFRDLSVAATYFAGREVYAAP